MDDMRYKPRRTATGFRIEDTRSGELVAGEEIEDFFVASEAARDRERSEWRENVAGKLEAAGWPEVAEDVRHGLGRETVLARLHHLGQADSDAARILAEAPREP